MRKLLLAGTVVLLMATGAAHAQSGVGPSGFFGPGTGYVSPIAPPDSNVMPITRLPSRSPSDLGRAFRAGLRAQRRPRWSRCVGNCPANCQASWQRLVFRTVEAFYALWGELNRFG